MGYLVFDIEAVESELISEWTPSPPREDGSIRMPPTYTYKPIVIAYALFDTDLQIKSAGIVQGTTEKEILQNFVELAGNGWAPQSNNQQGYPHAMITWGGRHFDVPLIVIRCMRYGIPIPWYYQLKPYRIRYAPDGHIDLCDFISDYGAASWLSLNVASKLIGLPGKMGIDGRQVAELYRDGKMTEIQDYCLTDVVETSFLFLRVQLMQGFLTLDRYKIVASSLLDALSRKPDRWAGFLNAIDRSTLLIEN